jgi:hypothetical protein
MPHKAAELLKQLDALHLRFQLHFADHVRLTRDLRLLDALIAEGQAIAAQAAEVQPPEPDDAWLRLSLAMQRRLELYTEARGAIAQAHAVAGLRDREASLLTGRGRLVLHRYVRHFAGQSRRTRDPGRLQEMIDDLLNLWRQLEPLAKRLQVPSVAEEVSAVGQFIGFFMAERDELQKAWRSGSRLEQADGLAEVVANLQADWQLLVLPTPRPLRRLALLDRLIGTLDDALGGLMALRHANMPDTHETLVQRASELLVQWHDERALTAEAQALAPAESSQLRALGRELFQDWRGRIAGEKSKRDRTWLAVQCDRLEEVERLLTERAGGLEDPELAWIRDALIAIERSHDGVVAAQESEAAGH